MKTSHSPRRALPFLFLIPLVCGIGGVSIATPLPECEILSSGGTISTMPLSVPATLSRLPQAPIILWRSRKRDPLLAGGWMVVAKVVVMGRLSGRTVLQAPRRICRGPTSLPSQQAAGTP